MKRFLNWQVVFGLVLVGLSALVYFVHYLIFHDVHHIFIYLIGDIGFVFIEVLMVTLGLHQLLHYREKRLRLNKMNMVIGVFFSEVGTKLIEMVLKLDENSSNLCEGFLVSGDWKEGDFLNARKTAREHQFLVKAQPKDLEDLKLFLNEKRNFLLSLLENQNLLEHEFFTDLLWAVFHLNEELHHRNDFSSLPDLDQQHLNLDIKRVCCLITLEWISYVEHLKKDYPYLFSLAIRVSPFDAKSSVVYK